MATPNVIDQTHDLEFYMTLEYTLVTSFEDGEWGALYLELPGLVGAGDTREDAIASLEEAKPIWFTSCLQSNSIIPEPLGFDILLQELQKIRPLHLKKRV